MSLVLRHSLFNQSSDNEIRHMSFDGWNVRRQLRNPFSFVSLTQTQLAILHDWHCNLTSLRAKLTAHTLTILDYDQFYVFKFGLTEWGDYCVNKNYETLYLYELPAAPLAVFFERKHKFVYSVETMVLGESYSASSRSDLGKEIVDVFNKWYTQHIRLETIGDWLRREACILNFMTPEDHHLLDELYRIVGRYSGETIEVTYIHGDVTFDNVRVWADRLYLIDWDRSGVGLIEHELWLTEIYSQVKSKQYFNERIFLMTMLDYLDSKMADDISASIRIRIGNKKGNSSLQPWVKALFIIRMYGYMLVQSSDLMNDVDMHTTILQRVKTLCLEK